VLGDAQRWIGALVVIAVAGAILTTIRAATHRESWSRSLLLWLCVGAALLAAPPTRPRIHTTHVAVEARQLRRVVRSDRGRGTRGAPWSGGRFWWKVPALAAVIVLTVPLAGPPAGTRPGTSSTSGPTRSRWVSVLQTAHDDAGEQGARR